MTTQSTPDVSVTDTQQTQVYEYFAQFVKEYLTDYCTDRDTAKVLLHEQIEDLGCLLDKLSNMRYSDVHFLNRAVSFYLMQSADNMNIKTSVTSAMNAAIETALTLSLHSNNIGCWSCLLNSIADNLNAINGAVIPAETPISIYDEIQNRINETDAIITKLEQK